MSTTTMTRTGTTRSTARTTTGTTTGTARTTSGTARTTAGRTRATGVPTAPVPAVTESSRRTSGEPAPAGPVGGGRPGGLRLTGRGRLVAAGLALAAAGLGVWGADAARAEVAGPAAVAQHVVLPGETLWGIAEGVAEPGQDVRDVVLDLVTLNGLPSSALAAGQTIVVPVGG
ncbi:LysM peptidoglycan-binding domain-containing protein [Cellulomonas endophytica]|uniref:LysM peptidoglycan-binding domain-containing protein n=1 Tax=Cellulomonas endophytica TaxID=2494735 RepID=UPI001F0BD3D2|nr:LysM peptidoglycan-binding domain-containing protein [Cellulomonas endophytica]